MMRDKPEVKTLAIEKPSSKWLWMAAMTAALLVVMITTTGFTGSINQKETPLVQVPVVLDGTSYSAEEFNQINISIHSKGIDLIYVVGKDEILIAFTTVAGFDAYASRNGLPTYSTPKSSSSVPNTHYDSIANAYYILAPDNVVAGEADKPSQSMTLSPIFDYAQNFEDINFGGSQLYVQCGAEYANLGDIGWNDRISSAEGPSTTSPDGREYLYEDIDFGGSVLIILTGASRSDLRSYGWNDRASSVRVIQY